MQVSGVRAVMAVRDALDRHGLVRTLGGDGGYLQGWAAPGDYDSARMNVRRLKDGTLDWQILVTGRPHLRYRAIRFPGEDGETLYCHEPIAPDELHGRVRDAFVELGMEPSAITNAGYRGDGFDDVSYAVRTPRPEWLPVQSAENSDPMAIGAPTLCTFALAPDSRSQLRILGDLCSSVRVHGRRFDSLVGYATRLNEPLLTRESVEALAGVPVRPGNGMLPSPEGGLVPVPETSAFLELEDGPDGTLDAVVRRRLGGWRGVERPMLAEPVRVACAKQETILNAWGDEVAVWRFPAFGLQRQRAFLPEQPVLVGGELRGGLAFREWDAQFGPSPWHPGLAAEPISAPAPKAPGR